MAEPGTLRVVQLNAGSLLEPDWEHRRHEIVAWLGRLDPDVVCLQEVWEDENHPNTAGWLAGEAATGRWHWRFGGHSLPPAVWPDASLRFGSAVLSRWPIDDHHLERLPADDAFPWDATIQVVHAHMHTRGARFKYEAIYPDNSSEVLLSVPFYVFHWQTTYRFAQPKVLPAGTTIRCTCAWDNSVQNQELMELYNDPDNPNNFQYNPSVPVTWGDQTWNEMFIGYFNYSEIP